MDADIALLGYYGRGNFGDDVLMVAAHGVARRIMPGARLAVRTGVAADYVERLLGSEIQRLAFGARGVHQMIIHGGGGTFFDFQRYGVAARSVNHLLLAAGPSRYVQTEGMLRRLAGRPRMRAKIRVGLGIGVGTYSAGSPKLRESLPVLHDFDSLWVRDQQSHRNLKDLGLDPPVLVGSDLAFLSRWWCPPNLYLTPAGPRPRRPRVGVILRDWPSGSGGSFAASCRDALGTLAQAYDLQLLCLDESGDGGTFEELRDLSPVVWQPRNMEIADFAQIIARQDVLLTARAHGAICGACMGRPSVLLDIEPKLRAVHEMLPNSSQLVAMDAPGAVLKVAIEQALTVTSDQIAEDVLRNADSSELALAAVMRVAG